MMKFKYTLSAMILLAALFAVPRLVGAIEPAKDDKLEEPIDVRAILEKGRETGLLPDGMVIRVSACLAGASKVDASGVPVSDNLRETWEFASGQVRLAGFEPENDKIADYQGESRSFDTKDLCKDLLDGNAIEIQARTGEGPKVGFIGTHYDRGGRSIEVEWKGETILHLFETNGPFLKLYPEADARAFGVLYKRLTSKARAMFEPKTVKERERSNTDNIAWGEAVNGLQLGIYSDAGTDGLAEVLFDGKTLRVNIQLRNAGRTSVRFLASIFGCAAMGPDGAIPVTKLILTPSKGGEPISIIYRSHNHLSAEGQLDAEDLEHFTTVLAPGQTLSFPYTMEYTPGEDRNTSWQRTGESNRIPEGKYQLKALLVSDRKESQWQGELTSGSLEVDIQQSDEK